MFPFPFALCSVPGIFSHFTELVSSLGAPTRMKPFTTPSVRDLGLAQWGPSTLTLSGVTSAACWEATGGTRDLPEQLLRPEQGSPGMQRSQPGALHRGEAARGQFVGQGWIDGVHGQTSVRLQCQGQEPRLRNPAAPFSAPPQFPGSKVAGGACCCQLCFVKLSYLAAAPQCLLCWARGLCRSGEEGWSRAT